MSNANFFKNHEYKVCESCSRLFVCLYKHTFRTTSSYVQYYNSIFNFLIYLKNNTHFQKIKMRVFLLLLFLIAVLAGKRKDQQITKKVKKYTFVPRQLGVTEEGFLAEGVEAYPADKIKVVFLCHGLPTPHEEIIYKNAFTPFPFQFSEMDVTTKPLCKEKSATEIFKKIFSCNKKI